MSNAGEGALQAQIFSSAGCGQRCASTDGFGSLSQSMKASIFPANVDRYSRPPIVDRQAESVSEAVGFRHRGTFRIQKTDDAVS